MRAGFSPRRLNATSALVASAFLCLFLFAHWIHHTGDDDHHQHHNQGRSCAICQVWSLPFIATPAVEFTAALAAGAWGPAESSEAPARFGVWLASPNRPPPPFLLSSR